MKYDIEKEQSFLGLFRTQKCWPDLKKMLEEWRENLAEPYRSKPFIEWDIIVFNIKDSKIRNNVYKDLVRAYACGWFKERFLKRLCRYLAIHTNLDDNENLEIRTNNIRHEFYNKMYLYEKERKITKKDETIVITTQQGYQSTNGIAATSGRVNPNWQ